MKENLIKLYGTLSNVETKGNSTKLMSDSLRFLETLINDCDANEQEDKE